MATMPSAAAVVMLDPLIAEKSAQPAMLV